MKRETTYNQPTRGVKLTESEKDKIDKLMVSMRKNTGLNVSFNTVVRGLVRVVSDSNNLQKDLESELIRISK